MFNSATPGRSRATRSRRSRSAAPATVVTVQTDGTGRNSADAVKTYVDANIQITPPTATNRVGTNHVFTAHVNVNNGTGGFQNAPDGTQISFTIDSGPGTLTTANPCTTTGGTGSCTITLTSSVTGVTTVSAHTTVSVGGVSLTRHTNGTGANSNPAVKTWVNARITIAPNATNAVGDAAHLHGHAAKDTGTGAFVPAVGEHVNFTLTNSIGAGFVLDAATSTCDNAGANTNAAGQCIIVFTSPTRRQGHGARVVHAGDRHAVRRTSPSRPTARAATPSTRSRRSSTRTSRSRRRRRRTASA